MPSLPTGIFGPSNWSSAPRTRTSNHLRGKVHHFECDVLVVGSGAGGATAAAELAEAGYDVLIVEEGAYHPTSEINAQSGKMTRMLYRDGGAQMALGVPPITFAEGRCVGGSTLINGGMTFRTPDHILSRWRVNSGISQLDEASLLPVFERVEAFMSAKKQDPHTIGRDNALLKEGADKLGWKVVENIRNQVHCAGSNNCAFGCPTGAKQSTLVSYIPRALEFGAQLLSNCRVDKVNFTRKLATGVSATFRDENKNCHRVEIHANKTILACGAIQTPALLMRSKFKSPSKQVGQNLYLHPNTKIVGFFDDPVRGNEGVHQAYQVREFEEDGMVVAAVNLPPAVLALSLPQYGKSLREILGAYNNLVVAGALIEDTISGHIRLGPTGRPLPIYGLTSEDISRLVRASALAAEILFAAGARRVLTPFEGVSELHNMDEARRLPNQRIPRANMEVTTVHMMGTARMGDNPNRDVCDSWGRVYDTAGLYIADASLFPSPIGVNPMETIMALATRCAQHITRKGVDHAYAQ